MIDIDLTGRQKASLGARHARPLSSPVWWNLAWPSTYVLCIHRSASALERPAKLAGLHEWGAWGDLPTVGTYRVGARYVKLTYGKLEPWGSAGQGQAAT
jgi:hypothetical protein